MIYLPCASVLQFLNNGNLNINYTLITTVIIKIKYLGNCKDNSIVGICCSLEDMGSVFGSHMVSYNILYVNTIPGDMIDMSGRLIFCRSGVTPRFVMALFNAGAGYSWCQVYVQEHSEDAASGYICPGLVEEEITKLQTYSFGHQIISHPAVCNFYNIHPIDASIISSKQTVFTELN